MTAIWTGPAALLVTSGSPEGYGMPMRGAIAYGQSGRAGAPSQGLEVCAERLQLCMDKICDSVEPLQARHALSLIAWSENP